MKILSTEYFLNNVIYTFLEQEHQAVCKVRSGED